MVTLKSIHVRRDRFAQFAIYTVAFLVCAAFVWILSDLVLGGAAHLSWNFLSVRRAMLAAQGALARLWFPLPWSCWLL